MLSDHMLRDSVENTLDWTPNVNDSEIGVSAKDGVVTLTGNVPSYLDRYEAERVVKRLYGVKALANDLKIHLPSSSERSDTDIAEAALSALKWHVSVPADKVKVLVKYGWITLEGEVDWQFQKTAAKEAVGYLMGVKGVTNGIHVKPSIEPGDVKEKIEDAFKRSAALDAKHLTVETHDHTVTLRGQVNSWSEYDEARDAAWAVPGVWNVENNVTVSYT